jgi:hypothetical protein
MEVDTGDRKVQPRRVRSKSRHFLAFQVDQLHVLQLVLLY